MTHQTDREVLDDCLKAFAALMGNAAQCHKVLKGFGQKDPAYAGSGQYRLARYMTAVVSRHLAGASVVIRDSGHDVL